METGNEKYITKKIGMPRMILALLGIMVVGMSTAWFGKNPKTEPSSQATQDTQKDFLSATQDQSEDTEKTTVLQKDESVSTVDSQPSQKEDVLEVSLIDSKIVLEEKKSEKNTNEQKKQAGDVKEQKPVQQSVTPPSEPVIVPTEKSVSQEEKPAAVEEQKPTQPVVIPSPRPVIQKKEFADGIYSASGLYISPAGGEEIHISLTLKDTMITGADFTGKAENPTSKQWQEIFNSGYREKVIGKPIKDLSLTVVSGSSLTPRGFMDAVEKIKQQARSS